MDKTYREFSTFWLTELDFYHHGKSLGVDERAITWDLRKLENFKKILEIFRIDQEVLNRSPNRKILTGVQNYEESAVKQFIEKPMLIDFVDL